MFHYKHMMDWTPAEAPDESCSSVLAQLNAAHPALTIVNEFLLTKEGCPAARPRRALPRSTGPWTRHSKPPFSIFQCGQEPAGFIGVFKSYSLKHSSSVSTRSRQFPFFSSPHFIFISRSPPSLCAVESLSLSKLFSHSLILPLFSPLNPSSYPQSSLQCFSLA